jgi:predicted MFS family arabinose efflux permease
VNVIPIQREDAALTRDLRLFNVYRFLSTSYLFMPVLVLFFQARGLDFTQIALLNSVYALTALVCEIPTGALADRFGRRFAMVAGSIMMAVGSVVDWRGHDFWTFALGEGLLALGMTLTSGADSAYLFDLLRAAGREHEYRRREGTATATKLSGAALALVAGGLLGKHDLALTYLVTAAVCATAGVVAWAMMERPFVRDDNAGFWPGMTHAALAVLSDRALRFAVFFSVLVFTLLRMGLYLHPAYLDKAGLDVAWIGGVMALLSIMGAVGAARIDSIRKAIGEATLVILLPLVLAATYFGLSAWFTHWGIALLMVQSVANGVYSPFSKELLNREIRDSGHRATILSVESMGRRLAFGAFAPLAGVLIDVHCLREGLWACGGLGLLGGGALVFLAVRRHRRGLLGFEGEITDMPISLAPPLSVADRERRITLH